MTTTQAEPPVIAAPRPAELPAPRKSERETHPVAAIILYLLAVFIGAALAAPRFLASAQFLAENYPGWRRLAEFPFHRYINRSLLLFALVGLPIFVKALGIPSFRALGLVLRRRTGAEWAQGLAWGSVALAFASALVIASGARTLNLDHNGAEILRNLRTAFLGALIVSVMEELLFRGALFSALRRRYAYWPAALWSCAFFAMLHFFQRPTSPRSIEWYSGFVTLGQMFHGFTDIQAMLPGFLNLLLTGLVLTLARERTGSLLFSMGLHAGVIFWGKTLGFATRSAEIPNAWIWGTGKLIDGWGTGVMLLALYLALRAVLPPRPASDA